MNARRIFLPGAALALLGLLCGCPPTQKGTPPSQGGSSGKVPQEQVRTEYRWPLPADPMTLDPAQLTDTVSDCVARRLYNTLLRFAPTGEMLPDLAEAYEMSPDGLSYTFTLRSGVRFHNGEPCTADDVAYSFLRVLDPATNSPRASLLYYVKGAKDFHDGKAKEVPGISVVDESTLKLTLDKPFAPFLNVLCMSVLAAVPKADVERDPQGFGDHPVGTGPFVFDSWERDSRITVKANRDYFGGTPAIQTLVFRVIKDEKTRFENFKAGELEHCDIPPSQIVAVRKDPALSALIHGEPAMDMYSYGFNCQKAPFKDNTALRQAFNYAVDREHIIETIWGGLVSEQKTYVPEGMFYFNSGSTGYTHDPEKAKALLEQAGYPGGAGLEEIVLNVDLQPTNKLVAEAVQEDLRRIGVKVRIETTDWGPFLEKIYAGEAQFHQNTWLTDYPDPDNWLFQLLDTQNWGDAGNTTRWSNSEFDHFVELAQVEPDQTKRKDLYQKAEDIAFTEAPWLLLFWKNSATLIQPYVRGLEVSRLDRTPQLNNVFIEQATLD